jgi:hypothetical protein
VSLDRLCAERLDTRVRVIGDLRAAVSVHASAERLRPTPPLPFPATITVERRVTANGRVAYRGNFYSVPPELAYSAVTVTARLGEPTVDIATSDGIVIARHRLAGDGVGAVIANHTHVTALNTAALAAFSDAPPHRSKARIPPGVAARAAAERLTRTDRADTAVVDLAPYARAANGRNILQ